MEAFKSKEDPKQLKWAEVQRMIEEIADRYGRGIENGIMETVIALNVNDISTSQSCEGHSEISGEHALWPWVEISAPNVPEEKFTIDENALFEETARKHNIPLEDLKHGHPWEVYSEVRRRVVQNPETEAYLKWQKENNNLNEKVKELLVEFYKGREIENDIKILAEESNGNSFEINSQKNFRDLTNIELTEQQTANLLVLLPKRREEMKTFTEFLKKKFLICSSKNLIEYSTIVALK